MARGQKRSVGRTTVLVMAALLALPVAAAIGFMALFDANAYKNEIEAAVRRATGRDFTVTGNIAVASFAQATLAADGLVLANIDGGSRPEMLKVARIEADLAFWPLLSGRLEIDRLVLQSPDLVLERDENGRENWRFEPQPRPAPAAPAPSATPAAPASRPQPIVVRTLHVRDGRLRYLDQRTGRTMLVEIRKLAATESAAGDRAQISAELVLDGRLVQVSGQSGSLARLLAPNPATPFGVVLTAQAAGARLTATGAVADPMRGQGYRFQLDGSTTNAGGLATLLGLPSMPLRNVAFSAQVADRAGQPEVTGLSLRAGASDLGALATGLKLEAVEVSAPAMDKPMQAELRGSMGGADLRVTARLGAPNLLLPRDPAAGASTPFPLDVTLALGTSQLSMQGAMGDPARLAGVDLALRADITDLQAFAPLLGTRLPALRDLHLEAQLTDAEGGLPAGFMLRRLALRLPQAELAGEAGLRAGRPAAVTLRLAGPRLALDPLLAAFGGVPLGAPAPVSSNALPVGTPEPPRRRLAISERRLGLEAIERLDLDARLSVGDLLAGGVEYRDVDATVRIAGGRLAIQPLSATLPGGKVEMVLTVESKGAASPVELRLQGPGLALKPLLAGFQRPEDIAGTLDAAIELRGRGETPHEIAATLTGRVGLALENGEVDNGVLLALLGGAQRLGRAASLLEGPGRTRLRCGALRLDFADGVGTASALVLDTQRLLLQGGGQIRLDEEALALRLRPLLRIGGPGIVLPLRIEGTLREPRIALDAAAAAVAGGEAALASQAGRDNLLGKLNAALGEMAAAERGGDACPAALAAARFQPPPAAPVAPAAPPPANNPANLLRRLLR